jgi:trans-aconitate methyltransferase
LILIIFLISALVVIIIGILIYYALDSAFGGLDFSSNRAVISQVAEIIRAKNLGQGVLYDLGSARGNFALKISDIFPNLKVYGIDDSRFRVNFARVRALLHRRRPQFYRQDIFNTDISAADFVYMFLEQDLVSELEEKLFLEMKPGSTVIINNTHFTNWPSSAFYQTDKNNQKRGRVSVYAKG